MQEIEYDLKKEKRKIIPLMRKFAQKCKACGLCVRNCVFHRFNKKDSVQITREFKEFLLSKKLDKKLSTKTRKYIWTCGVCEHCMDKCPLPEEDQFPRSAMIVLTRAILVAQNKSPPLIRFLRRFIFKDVNSPILKHLWNIVSQLLVPDWYDTKDPMKRKIRSAIDEARSPPKSGAEVCFSAGCGHTWGAPDVVYSEISILEDAGVDFITIGNPEWCCGVVYIALGFFDLWLERTQALMQQYLKLKPRPKKIVLHCPGCYIVYTIDLSKYGIILPLNYLQQMPSPIDIIHITEYNYQLIKENKIELKKEVPMTVTYYDNCSLGRRSAMTAEAIYDQPREMLKSIPGLQLVEADKSREDAYCCGLLATKTLGFGTNLRGLFGKDNAYKIQRDLYQELLEKGSQNLILPCMGCAIAHEDSTRIWRSKLGQKLNVFDVNELLNLAMGKIIPRRQLFINDALQLSFPFIKPPILKIIPRMMKSGALLDMLKLITEMISYEIKRKNG